MGRLEALMKKTDIVEIKGPDTDLRFSIKDIGAVSCGGEKIYQMVKSSHAQ